MGQGQSSRSQQLVASCAAGDVEAVRRLLEAYILQEQRKKQGGAGLQSAAIPKHLQDAQTLDQTDPIDINFTLPEGDFPLELATTNGHSMVVQLLIEHGANVDQQDRHGLTALMCCCHEMTTATLQIGNILIKHGNANVNLTDESGSTALHFATQYGHAPFVQMLLDARANPDIQNKKGETPLFLSALKKNDTISQLLIQAGADPTIPTKYGRKPIDMLPEHLGSVLRAARCTRRCDRLIATLYPHLTTSLIAEIVEYEPECYIDGKCIGMKRLLVHMEAMNEAQDRAEAVRRQQQAAGLLSPDPLWSASPEATHASPSSEANSSVSVLPPPSQSAGLPAASPSPLHPSDAASPTLGGLGSPLPTGDSVPIAVTRRGGTRAGFRTWTGPGAPPTEPTEAHAADISRTMPLGGASLQQLDSAISGVHFRYKAREESPDETMRKDNASMREVTPNDATAPSAALLEMSSTSPPTQPSTPNVGKKGGYAAASTDEQ